MVQWKCRCLKSFECWVWKSFEAKAFKTSARVHGYPESYVTVTVIRTPSVLEAPQLQAWLGSMKMSGAPLGTRYSGLQSWYGLMRLFEAWSIQDEIFFSYWMLVRFFWAKWKLEQLPGGLSTGGAHPRRQAKAIHNCCAWNCCSPFFSPCFGAQASSASSHVLMSSL